MLVTLAYKRSGLICALLTLLIWSAPAVMMMLVVALAFHYLSFFYDVARLTRFVQPMGVAFVWYAFVVLCRQMKQRWYTRWIVGLTLGVAFFWATPYLLPLFFLIGGLSVLLLYARGSWRRLHRLTRLTARLSPEAHLARTSQAFRAYGYLLLWGLLLLVCIASEGSLFPDFYLQGSSVFGGGQVFMPFLFTEYVAYQKYVSAEEFLSAFALMQALPGPIFAFTAYVGAMAMREYGLWAQLGGGLIAVAGFFLPATLWALAVTPLWLRWRGRLWVRAVLEGVTATSVGLVGAAALRLFIALEAEGSSYLLLLLTLLLLFCTRMPYIGIVMIGLLAAVLMY